ncbi:hypothetical protein D3C76_383290 [compost metagenome]
MRQAVGLFVQLAVAQQTFLGPHCNRIRCAHDLSFNQPMQGLLKVVSHRSIVEALQQPLALIGIGQPGMGRDGPITFNEGPQ